MSTSVHTTRCARISIGTGRREKPEEGGNESPEQVGAETAQHTCAQSGGGRPVHEDTVRL